MRTSVLFLVLLSFSFGLQAQKPSVAKALKAMKNGDLANAVAEIERASKTENLKDDPKTWWARAQIFITADTSKANIPDAFVASVHALGRTVELSNGDVSKLFVTGNDGFPVPFDQYRNNYWAYYFNKGALAYGNSDYTKAVSEFERAQLIHPADTNAYINAALAAHNIRDWKSAKRNYQNAIERGVHSKDIFSLYVSILNSDENTRQEALEVIQQARAIYPKDNELARSEINVLIQLGRAAEARSNLEKQIIAEPDNPVLYFSLGVMLEEMGDKKGAIQAYNAALKADPNDYNANFNVAVMLINEATDIIKRRNKLSTSAEDLKMADKLDVVIDEKLTEAMPLWEKVHQLEPKDRTALETLRYIYSQLEMMEEAVAIQHKLDALASGG